MAGDYAESPAKPQVFPDQLLAYCFFSGAVVLLPEPDPMPLDPGVVGLVVVPVELEPLVLPEAPLRASSMHLSRSAPVRPTHLLASLPDAPDAAPVEPDVEVSLPPEDELPVDGVADGVDELPAAPAPVLLLLEPEDCANATPDRARSAAAVAAVRVFNIMESSPSKGG